MSNQNDIKEIIKAVLFVSGEGVEIDTFALKFNLSKAQMQQIIEQLKNEFCKENGIHLITYSSKIQLSSNPNYADEIASVLNPIREKALTKAVMQTLSIIAYKQPVTRLEIESIRGVSADYALQVLLENNMIKVVGRKDVVGKPLLFGTTEEFLKRFDLQNITDLPDYEKLLERIKLIKEENTSKSKDNLYNDYEIKDENLQEYVTGREQSKEELQAKKQQEDLLVQKFKDIDGVLRKTKAQENQENEQVENDKLNEIFSNILTNAQNEKSDLA